MEQSFGGLKLDKFWKKRIHPRYLRPLSKAMVAKLKYILHSYQRSFCCSQINFLHCRLSPQFAKIPLAQLMWACTVEDYNEGHRKYGLVYTSEENQRLLVNKIMKRLNLVNPFTVGFKWPFAIKR